MIYRSKAPLRLGLAGGGTDVSPYSDRYGGAILNATISLYAYASITPTDEATITIHAADKNETVILPLSDEIELTDPLLLARGVYNRIVKDYSKVPSGFKLTTFVDAPAGSGLGSSSALVVAMVGAFAEWLNVPLGEYDIASLAYAIERCDLKMSGGKQDQYAAAFGGFNFMEFAANDNVIVNPLRIKIEYLSELQNNLLLYFTETSRLSSSIIDAQRKNVTENNKKSIDAMHQLKAQSVQMKEALLKGRVHDIGKILDFGFQSKKQMTTEISNSKIDSVYETALRAGATGGKISGAGGGGFMMFYCPNTTKYTVKKSVVETFGGAFKDYVFVKNGVLTWRL